jgi:hypothetical protein
LGGIGAAGCAAILGIDDRKLDSQLADGSIDQAAEGSRDSAAGSSTDGPAADSGFSDGVAARDTTPGGDAPATDSGNHDAPMSDSPTADVQVDAPNCPDPCVLATGLDRPFLMTSDISNVYWTEFGDSLGAGNGSVKACPIAGCGASPVIYAQGVTNPRGIAVDGRNVYWGSATFGGVVGGIWSCPLSATTCSPTMLAPAGTPYGVAVDAAFVYWVDLYDKTAHRVPKAGGPDAGGDTVLWDASVSLTDQPFQCVVDGPFLYFMDYSENAFRLSVNGGAPAFLGNGNNGSIYGNSFGITTDSTSVYFGGNGLILRADKLTIDSGVPIATTVPDPSGLAYDQSTGMLYWANWGSGSANDGTVGKLVTDGGGALVLAASLATPTAVTVSGNYVFWVSEAMLDDAGSTLPNSGMLFRRAK